MASFAAPISSDLATSETNLASLSRCRREAPQLPGCGHQDARGNKPPEAHERSASSAERRGRRCPPPQRPRAKFLAEGKGRRAWPRSLGAALSRELSPRPPPHLSPALPSRHHPPAAAARRHSSALSSTARAPAGARGILGKRLGDVATGISAVSCGRDGPYVWERGGDSAGGASGGVGSRAGSGRTGEGLSFSVPASQGCARRDRGLRRDGPPREGARDKGRLRAQRHLAPCCCASPCPRAKPGSRPLAARWDAGGAGRCFRRAGPAGSGLHLVQRQTSGRPPLSTQNTTVGLAPVRIDKK